MSGVNRSLRAAQAQAQARARAFLFSPSRNLPLLFFIQALTHKVGGFSVAPHLTPLILPQASAFNLWSPQLKLGLPLTPGWPRGCNLRLASSAAESVESTDAEQTRDASAVNFKGLKSEVNRQVSRQIKKVGKADLRVKRETERLENGSGDEEEVLEAQAALEEYRTRLQKLNDLEEALAGMKSNKDDNFPSAWELAQELEVSDSRPPQAPRGKSKPKGKPQARRKPYWIYNSKDNIEIWVGRGAKDNDQLSLKERDPRDWWLHVSGCPGSHVVIRYTDEDPPRETVLDAATLALEFSKGGQQAGVSLTRCRDVTKRPGAPAGQVWLRGEIQTIKINLKTEAARLQRLMETKSTETIIREE